MTKTDLKQTKNSCLIDNDNGNCFGFYIRKSIYNDHTIFMVSWWGRYSYFNK